MMLRCPQSDGSEQALKLRLVPRGPYVPLIKNFFTTGPIVRPTQALNPYTKNLAFETTGSQLFDNKGLSSSELSIGASQIGFMGQQIVVNIIRSSPSSWPLRRL